MIAEIRNAVRRFLIVIMPMQAASITSAKEIDVAENQSCE